MMRTTTAATMLSASVKENVLPIEAIATINFRIHPRDTVEDVIAHVRKVVDNDEIEVRVKRIGAVASGISSIDSEGFRDIAAAVGEIEGDVISMPGLTIGGTDSRHFSQIAKDAYPSLPTSVRHQHPLELL